MKLPKFVRKFASILIEEDKENDDEEMPVLQVSFRYMRTMNLFPHVGESFNSKKYWLRSLFTLMLNKTSAMGVLINLVHIYYSEDNFALDDLINDFTIGATALNMFFEVYSFIVQRKKILELCHSLGDFSEFPKPKNFDRANRNMNFMTKLFMIYSVSGVLIYSLLAFMSRDACDQESIEKGYHRVCGLLYPVLLPEYFRNFPYYYIAFLVQVMNSVTVLSAGTLIIAFICGIMHLITCHTMQLKRLLSECFDPKNEMERKERLKFCVKYHVRIIELTDQMNTTLGTAAFANATFTGIVIAIISFQYTMLPQVMILLHGMGWLITLFLLSYFGQQLINESEEIPFQIYSSEWITGDLDSQKYLLMIIGRGNQYLFLDAKGFGEVRLATFAAAIKSAYSLLTLLHSKQEETALNIQ